MTEELGEKGPTAQNRFVTQMIHSFSKKRGGSALHPPKTQLDE
jgi:hypothetical protein